MDQLPVRVRRNLKASADLRSKYVEGVLLLKKETFQGPAHIKNHYDKYINWHLEGSYFQTSSSGRYQLAHEGPAFLPWHRYFLYLFEQDLCRVLNDPYFALPYWSWTEDTRAPGNSLVWSDDFMGGEGQPIQTGPFKKTNWKTLEVDSRGAFSHGSLTRQFGNKNTTMRFPTKQDVKEALAISNYDTRPWNKKSVKSFRNHLEGIVPNPSDGVSTILHNALHTWVGGSMARVPTSPNDPVFYLHHCNVDKIWDSWQRRSPTHTFKPKTGAETGHNFDDGMLPFEQNPPNKVFVHTGLTTQAKLGYCYDTLKVQDLSLVITTSKTLSNSFFSKTPGTNSDVYLKIMDKNDKDVLGNYQLDSPGDDFEPGQTETFSLRLPKPVRIGDLKELRFYMKHFAFFSDDWNVQNVMLSMMIGNQDYLILDEPGFYLKDLNNKNYGAVYFPSIPLEWFN